MLSQGTVEDALQRLHVQAQAVEQLPKQALLNFVAALRLPLPGQCLGARKRSFGFGNEMSVVLLGLADRSASFAGCCSSGVHIV